MAFHKTLPQLQNEQCKWYKSFWSVLGALKPFLPLIWPLKEDTPKAFVDCQERQGK